MSSFHRLCLALAVHRGTAGLLPVGGIAIWAALLVPDVSAAVTVYRCEGRPALYTTDTRQVRDRRCQAVSGPHKSPSADRARALAGEGAARRSDNGSAAASVPTTGEATRAVRGAAARGESAPSAALVVPAGVQRVRDHERLRILQDELATEEARLTELRARRAVAPRESDRVNADVSGQELDRAVQRSEQSIAALRREIETARR